MSTNSNSISHRCSCSNKHFTITYDYTDNHKWRNEWYHESTYSLSGNLLTRKEVMRARESKIRAGEGTIRAGQDF